MKLWIVIAFLFVCRSSMAQPRSADSSLLISQNQQIDDDVVSQNLQRLSETYADDFVFSHGSGRVDNKYSWLKSVGKGGFLKRTHDSTTVEMHDQIAIVRGKLHVHKKTATGINAYQLWYVRVYSQKSGRWQLMSHITTTEFHDPPVK